METQLVITDSLRVLPELQTARRVFDSLDITETTRKDYQDRIAPFLDFLNTHPLTINSFLEYKNHLACRSDYSVSTKNKYLVTARIFLKELSRRGLLPCDITPNVKAFKQLKRHKRDGLNSDEIQLLTHQVKDLPLTPANTRLKAILSLLTLQGLRQIEVIRLDVSDLDLVRNIALIRGKGEHDKEPIDLHPETVKALKEYLKTNHIADGPLFTSFSNNSKRRRLTTRSIRQVVSSTLSKLGIEKTTHGFRHYFTTKLVQVYKGDLLEVARYTRHKSLEMLQVYNDNINRQADLPRYYGAFEGISF